MTGLMLLGLGLGLGTPALAQEPLPTEGVPTSTLPGELPKVVSLSQAQRSWAQGRVLGQGTKGLAQGPDSMLNLDFSPI